MSCIVSHSLFFISSFFCPREAWISVNRARFEQWTDSMQGNQFWGEWMAICFSAAAIRIMATIRGDCLSGDIRQTTCTWTETNFHRPPFQYFITSVCSAPTILGSAVFFFNYKPPLCPTAEISECFSSFLFLFEEWNWKNNFKEYSLLVECDSISNEIWENKYDDNLSVIK